MLKRTFIPPSFRPHIKGSKIGILMEKSSTYFDEIRNDRLRRQLIVDLLRHERIDCVQEQLARNLFREIFPGLVTSKKEGISDVSDIKIR